MKHKTKFLIALGLLVLVFFISPFANTQSKEIPKQDTPKITPTLTPSPEVQKIVDMANQTIEKTEELIGEVEENEMPEFDIKLSRELQEYTYNLCNEYNLSYTMVLALLYQESRFNIYAVNVNTNGTRDEGIAQLNKRYSKTFATRAGIKNFNTFNPKHNIKAAIVHLNGLRDVWIDKGYTSQELLFPMILGAFNRGVNGLINYHRYNGNWETEYCRKIEEWKYMLETEGRLPQCEY